MGGNTTVFPPQKSLAGLQATAAEIDAAVENQYSPLINNKPVSGRYMITPMHSNTGQTATQTNTQIVFVPIWISKPITINALVFKVSATANAGEKVIMGIYAESDNGGVGLLVAKSSEVTLGASTYTTYECPVTPTILPAGKYWIALDKNGITTMLYGCNANVAPLLWASMSFQATTSFLAGKNSFPAYTYTYNSDLPSDLSAIDVQTTMGAVAIAPSLGLKLA